MRRLTTSRIAGIAAGFLVLLAPALASAHEVYVLSSGEITSAIATPPFDMMAVIRDNLGQFAFWAFLCIMVVAAVFFASIIRFAERPLHGFFSRIRRYAPLVSRVTVGLSFLAGAYYQASYGPELPLAAAYGHLTPYVVALLYALGVCIIFGWLARSAALVALVLYGIAVWHHGWYMLTYVNYLGEFVILLLVGAHHRLPVPHAGEAFAALKRFAARLAPAGFAILRVCFGLALIYTSLYAKVIHNNLALDTVTDYHLDAIFHLEPHFLVLGAAIIEVVMGLFFVFGFEIRFASLFFEFWLTLSLCFFGEAVWPHLILIGIPIALIMYGYDKYSIEGYLFRKKEYQPIL